MPDNNEKEIICQFDFRKPEYFYTKPLYSDHLKIHFLIYKILSIICVIVVIVFILMLIFNPVSTFYSALVIPVLLLAYTVKDRIITPLLVKKGYKKIHAENEDLVTYTFYSDSVNIKSPTLNTTYNYSKAERYMEDSKRIALIFALNRHISVEKSLCTEEQLNFIRNIVPEEKQKKYRKKSSIMLIICILLYCVAIFYIGSSILKIYDINKNTYYLEYPKTTYESFEKCLDNGTIKDVLIIKDEFVEYTYTGHDKDERYYTVCSKNIKKLKTKLDNNDISWKSKDAEYCIKKRS